LKSPQFLQGIDRKLNFLEQLQEKQKAEQTKIAAGLKLKEDTSTSKDDKKD